MFNAEECVFRYRKLLQLLEEDTQEISHSFQGQLLDEYRGILTLEKDILSEALRTMINKY